MDDQIFISTYREFLKTHYPEQLERFLNDRSVWCTTCHESMRNDEAYIIYKIYKFTSPPNQAMGVYVCASCAYGDD
jgi:hypothetical protein